MEVTEYKHLCITLDKFDILQIDENAISESIRRTYYSLSECGGHSEFLNPNASFKMYSSVVLPPGLFGSELWSHISNHSLHKLEIVHRFCLKHIQGVRRRTKTDIATRMIAPYPLEMSWDTLSVNQKVCCKIQI